MIRAACAVVVAVLLGSCNVNDYCLNCAALGDGGLDGDNSDADGGGGDTDASDGSICVPTGPEVCNGEDDDCDGTTDEGPLPAPIGNGCTDIGGVSGAAVGECAGGINICAGGVVKCDKPPMAESCDNKDNNCNGTVDENNPEGGASCGTNAGECVAGTITCDATTHTLMCKGATGPTSEICDNLDNDCDGFFDNATTGVENPKLTQGVCGGGPGLNPNEGECQQGMSTCTGGVFVCLGSTGPTFEQCDVAGLDQDCDGQPNNGYNTNTDPQNCGGCGTVCNLTHAFEGCGPPKGPNGMCTVLACEPGYHDVNGSPGDGCESGPCTITGNEVCNGQDDDCNGVVDDNLGTPPAICGSGGECGTPGPIAQCMGAQGWRCSYPGVVQTDANGLIVSETICDTLDNDCDSAFDESQPNLNDSCTDLGIGICQGTGAYECDPIDNEGPAICVIDQMGQTPGIELCDDKDNNCDGIVDNKTGTDRVVDAMTHVMFGANNFYIDTYEASRPDATTTNVSGARACSNASVPPWRGVTFANAQAACAAAGKFLCSGPQWQAACEGATNTTYPYGNAFAPASCNTESYDGIPGGFDNDVMVATGALGTCTSGPGVFDMSGNLKEWTDDVTGQTMPGGIDIAVLRGGGYDSPAVGATCDFRLTRSAVNVVAAPVGFRCCRLTAP